MDCKTTVAILNWNGRRHLEEFLPSVVRNSPEACIVVVDNGSADDSLEWLARSFPAVEIMRLGGNFGFTGGYNRALKQLSTPFVVLLNSDVEVAPGWIAPLESALESDASLAACQPRILSYRRRGYFEYAGASGGFIDSLAYPFCRGRMLQTCEPDEGQYEEAVSVFWASGACMMVRREVFLQEGGFEESFFAHMEEIDFCWRLWHRGYRVGVVPASVVYHLGAGTLAHENPRKTFLNFRNGLAMLLKNETGPGLYPRLFLRLLLDGVAGLKFLAEGDGRNTLAVVRAHFSVYRRLGFWLSRRKENRAARTTDIPRAIRYPGLIVWAYFGKGLKRFSDLGTWALSREL